LDNVEKGELVLFASHRTDISLSLVAQIKYSGLPLTDSNMLQECIEWC